MVMVMLFTAVFVAVQKMDESGQVPCFVRAHPQAMTQPGQDVHGLGTILVHAMGFVVPEPRQKQIADSAALLA
jgi:hypothetical protein